MNLQALYLQTLLTVAPPGHTHFSVVPVECPASSVVVKQTKKGEVKECSGYSDYAWSSFYNSFVRKETEEEGMARYEMIANVQVELAQKTLCLDEDLNKVQDCNRDPLFKGWKFLDFVSIGGAAMIAESGIREDVEVGRGRSGKPSDDGGQGIGPGGEVCLVQLHPTVLAKFKVDPQSFLGANEEALNACFSFGMGLFARSRNMCSWRAAKTPDIEHDWVFEMFSAYGTGITCESANNGKTAYRRSLYSTISSDFGARIKKEQRRIAKEKARKAKEESPTLPVPPPEKM